MEDDAAMPSESPGPVTRLLQEWQDGNAEATDRLVPLVYAELRRLAAAYIRAERSGHTLQPTALVHEAFLRLVDQRSVEWKSRTHFIGIAAQLMRRILVDHARRHTAAKRGGGRKVTLTDEHSVMEAQPLDLLQVDDALARLTTYDPQQGRIVELRFFGGLDIVETAEALGISPATVKRDWTHAKAWLHRELNDGGLP